jgi:hypothetical protein
MDSRFATLPSHVMWPQATGEVVMSMLYPTISHSCLPTSISRAVVRGDASVATLFGLSADIEGFM